MENIDISLIQQDQTADKRVISVYERLKRFRDCEPRRQWLERRKEAWKAIENEMWDEKTKKEMSDKSQVATVINKCVKGVQGSAAVATDQRPDIKFHPIGSNDLYVAELLKRAHDTVWHKNEGNDVVYDFVEEAKIGGVSLIETYLDKSLNPFGVINFEEITPEDVYWDKDSRKRDMSDTDIIVAKPRTLEYIKDHYGNLSDSDIYFKSFDKEDEAKSEGVTGGDNYAVGPDDTVPEVDKKRQKIIWEVNAYLKKTIEQDYQFTLDADGTPTPKPLNIPEGQGLKDVVDFDKDVPTVKGQDNAYYWKRKRTVRVQRIIVGKKLISEKTNPLGEDADGRPVLPLVVLKAQRTRTAYPMSPTNYALPINKEKNKRRSQAIYAAAMNYASPIVRTPDAKWSGKKGSPDSELVVGKNAAFQPYRLTGGTLDIGILFQLENQADQEIDEMYDLHEVVKGKLPEGNKQIAGRTVLALQDFAGTMSKPFIRSLESALVRLAKANIAIILKSFQRPMWERLLEPEELTGFAPEESNEAKELAETGEDEQAQSDIGERIAEKWQRALEIIRPLDITKPPGLSVIDLDVRISAGSSMPTSRIAKMEMAIELVGAGIYDREAALEYVDDPNRDKIIERMKKAEEAAIQNELMKGK